MPRVRGDVVGGEHEIERLLEAGGAAEIYRARHLLSGRRTVLKVLRAAEPWCAARVEEAGVLRHLEDDGLVACVGAGPAGRGRWFFAFEEEKGPTLEGGDLRLTISRPELVELGARVAGALATLHEADVTHGHVRPDRIVRSERRRSAAMLLDCVLSPEQAWSAGAAAYLAPELTSGAGPEPAGDVYALGVILGCAAGSTKGEGPPRGTAALLRSLFEPSEPPEDREDALASWLDRMRAPSPGDRPEARQVALALGAIAEGRPAPVLPVAASHAARLSQSGRPIALLLLRPPMTKSAAEAGLDHAWRRSMEGLGATVLELVDGSVACVIDRGKLPAVTTTVALAVRMSQEHAFRASIVAGLLSDGAALDVPRLRAELEHVATIAGRIAAGVCRFTASLASRMPASAGLRAAGDSYLMPPASTSRPKRGGTLEMEAPANDPPPESRKRRSADPEGPAGPRKRRGGTLEIEVPREKRAGGTLEIEAGAAPPEENASNATPTLELFVDDMVVGGLGAEAHHQHPTLEVEVDERLLEATRSAAYDRSGKDRGADPPREDDRSA